MHREDLILMIIIYLVGMFMSYSLLKEDHKIEINFFKKLKIESMIVFWPILCPIYLYFFLSKFYRVRIYIMLILAILFFYIILK